MSFWNKTQIKISWIGHWVIGVQRLPLDQLLSRFVWNQTTANFEVKCHFQSQLLLLRFVWFISMSVQMLPSHKGLTSLHLIRTDQTQRQLFWISAKLCDFLISHLLVAFNRYITSKYPKSTRSMQSISNVATRSQMTDLTVRFYLQFYIRTLLELI